MPHSVQNGIIAWFDILGYSSFVKNCDAQEDGALHVVTTIASAEETVRSYIEGVAEAVGGSDRDVLVGHCRCVKWVVFSDTVLMLTPLESEMDSAEILRRWHVVILSAQILSKHMFEEGLPLRGCIASGRFLLRSNCFAGRAILEAYELAGKLQFAGSVLHPQSSAQLSRVAEPFARQGDLTAKMVLMGSFVDWRCEVDGQQQNLRALDFLGVKGVSRNPSAWAGSAEEIVERSFQKHRKSVGRNEREKITNTALFLNHVDRQFPGALTEAAAVASRGSPG